MRLEARGCVEMEWTRKLKKKTRIYRFETVVALPSPGVACALRTANLAGSMGQWSNGLVGVRPCKHSVQPGTRKD